VTSKSPIRVEFAPYFLRAIKQLQKRYPHISDDVQPLVQQLAQGETPGDQVPGIQYPVYKVRVRNRDAGRGKSGGYRVLYYIRTTSLVILATIYSKSDQRDISTTELRRIIEEYENR
jgi:mRNA-degrading endonuclease RelE of RelBE toxin-antitoxin system